MLSFGMTLAANPEVESDRTLLLLVQSHHIEERIRLSLPQCTPSQATILEETHFEAEAHADFFHNEVEIWRSAVTGDIMLQRKRACLCI
jgi:hypothetical protein